MNKNKKRLSKLLVPMLALSGITMNNTDAAERNVSVGKVKNDILNSLRHREDPNFVLKGKNRDVIVAKSGKAYDELTEKYELLDSFKSIKYRYDLNTKNFYEVGSGKDGTVSLCRRKSDRKIFVVKRRPFRNNGYSPADKFYEDSKTNRKNWKSKKWAVLKQDKYMDLDGGSLTVTEHVNGKTLKEYIKTLKKETFSIKIKKLLEIMKEFEKIICDLAKQGCVIYDLNPENIMLTNSPQNKNEIILKVVDYDDYDNNVTSDQALRSGYYSLNLLFLEAAKELFNYNELKKDYTKLKEKGMENIEIWYPPYKNNKSKEMMNALLFLELAEASNMLGGEPRDENGDYVFTPTLKAGNIQPNRMYYVETRLAKELPQRLKNRQENNYSPYLKHY